MDTPTIAAQLGQQVSLKAIPTTPGQPPIGTAGFVTHIGRQGLPNPIQVTFEDADQTVRHYSSTQFATLFTVLA